MSAILEIKTNYVESQSNRVYPEVWNNNDEWVAVPPEFEAVAVENSPYISVTYAADKRTIVGITATQRPEPETPQKDTVTVLREENEQMKQQITDLQLALAELYETTMAGR